MSLKKTRASRAKYECPEQLQELIELANLVGSSVKLLPQPDIEQRVLAQYIQEKRITGSQGMTDKQYVEYLLAVFDACYEGFPSGFIENLSLSRLRLRPIEQPSDRNWKDLRSAAIWAIQHYMFIREIRTHLYFLATELVEMKHPEGSPDFTSTVYMSAPNAKAAISFLEDAHGDMVANVDLALPVIVDAVRGTYIYDRLRLCTICRKVFWAKRRDSETDSAKCLNSLRQRRYRESNRSELNAKRSANYRIKKLGIVK